MREVVVFDSGIGGLSILQEIIKLDLGYPLVYLADQANFPYGDRSPAWISQRLVQVAGWVQKRDPAAFVIACNTATVNAIGEVRQLLTCPVVGVEPVTKPLGKYQQPLLLATKTTLSTLATPSLSICPNGLVRAIEDLDQAKITSSLSELASIISDNQVDAIGLSCTHYPLVKTQLRQLYPDLSLIDPSLAVARRLQTLVTPNLAPVSQISYLTTGDPTKLTSQVQYYLDQVITSTKVTI